MTVDLLLISGSFAPKEGGAEKQLRKILQQMIAADYKVVVITQAIPGTPLKRVELVDDIEIRRLGSPRLFESLPRLGTVMFSVSALLEASRMKANGVITLQLGAATAVGAIVSRARQIRHIVRLTGGGTHHFRSEVFSRKSKFIGRALLRLIDRRGTTIVAPAKHLVSDFLQAMPTFSGKTRHIINGVEETNLTGIIRKPQVAWYSRKGTEKSYDLLTSIVETLPEVSFVVIGTYDGPSLPNNVRILGWQEHPEYTLAQCSLLLNTSGTEGMPNTVLQALAAGCAIIGLDNPGMREVREMYPRSVEVYKSTGVEDISGAIRRRIYDFPESVRKVPSISDVYHEWVDAITDHVP